MPLTSGALSFQPSTLRMPASVFSHLRNQRTNTTMPMAISQP